MDEKYMAMALKLAEKGKGRVNPNPLVGAVIVKNEKIIGMGYHEEYGQAHAEINAFNNARNEMEDATLYVTLEPCSHYGKTPPCVEKIIEYKIARVVIGMIDPNPLVSGNGIKKLQKAGIEVVVGILEKECKKINEVFIKYITKKQPFVVLKGAMSLDGKLATKYGESKWITEEKAREEVHRLRNELTGIMVGINTVIIDNPQLTCRVKEGRNPIKIIVDSKLRIPLKSNIVKNLRKDRVIIATTNNASKEKCDYLEGLGAIVIKTNSNDGKVDLQNLMTKLAELNIDSILLEGGATLNYAALEEGIVDKVLIYIAPKIIGGREAKTLVEGCGINRLTEAFKVENLSTRMIGRDILIEGYIKGDEN